MGLKALQALAEKKGVTLNVGHIDKENVTPSVISGDSTGPEPIEIGARVVAHITHRIPLVRSVGKKIEGRDKKAGILSDLLALGVQLYQENAELLNEHAGNAIEGVVQNLTTKTAQPAADAPVIIDFGAVAPNGDNNNNNGGI